MKPTMKPPGSQRLKREHEKLLSNIAFNFNLRRYNLVDEEFRSEQKVIAATVRELLKAYLRSKHPAATVGRCRCRLTLSNPS